MKRIRNWEKFQHFKDRNLIWIKVYTELVDDPDWHGLDPFYAKVLVNLWCVAAKYRGNLPCLKKLAFRLRMTEEDTANAISALDQWLEDVEDDAISTGYQDDALEENRIDKKRIEKNIEEKIKHLDAVMLTALEYEKLVSKFGEAGCAEKIARLNNYIMSKGKRYKSHYHTILNWSEKDPKPTTPPPPQKSRALCAWDGCDRLGVIGQGGRMYCREHNPDRAEAL